MSCVKGGKRDWDNERDIAEELGELQALIDVNRQIISKLDEIDYEYSPLMEKLKSIEKAGFAANAILIGILVVLWVKL